MQKIISATIVLVCLFVLKTDIVSADTYVVSQSAKIISESKEVKIDYRVVILKKYLEGHKSPLANHAKTFILMADKYDLDWRLVPAISGVESTFGKKIPYNSFNAYGWANGTYRFNSWDESIEVVSKALREKYIDRGATTIDTIAIRYAPPSKTWAWKVKWFMNEINSLPLEFTL